MVDSCSIQIFTDLYSCLQISIACGSLVNPDSPSLIKFPLHSHALALFLETFLSLKTHWTVKRLWVCQSMVRWHTWSRYIQILLALRMLRSESFMPGSRCLQHPKDFNTCSHRFWCSALQRSRQPTLTVLNSSSELRWLCQILGPSCIQAQLVGKKNGRRYDCPNLWSLECAVKEDSNYI